jgi:hypothetical protein
MREYGRLWNGICHIHGIKMLPGPPLHETGAWYIEDLMICPLCEGDAPKSLDFLHINPMPVAHELQSRYSSQS